MLNNKIIVEAAIILLRFTVPFLISHKGYFADDKARKRMTALSVILPIITLMICVRKHIWSSKKLSIIYIVCALSLVLAINIGYLYNYNQADKYYDKYGNESLNAYDMIYTNQAGIDYSFRYDKTGYDYLYSSNTKLNADWCYLDEDGTLYYDDDMSIVCKNESSCIDTNGKIYYPVKYSRITKDGAIEYHQPKDNFSHDRLGNAYAYEYAPYYDINGNKYYYSFNSSSQKGSYKNINTNRAFENEYSFVDENGYLVYDENHEFKQEPNSNVYRDSKGKFYYWASAVTWNENGELILQ